MRIAMALLAVSVAFGAAGCKKDKTDPGTSAGSAAIGSGSATGADPGAAAGSAAVPATAPAVSDTPMSRRGGNCPSTVAGSTTTAETKDATIVVTVSATDKDAIAAIQKRSQEVLATKAAGGQGAGHDQKGMHGGGIGLCPLHLGAGGTASAVPTETGVVVTITPVGDAAALTALKAEIDARIVKSAEWVKTNIEPGDQGTTGGVGGGSGEHGSNHSGEGDGKGKDRKGDGKGGGKGTGGGGGAGTGGGSETAGSAAP